jgi:hypothetical protein
VANPSRKAGRPPKESPPEIQALQFPHGYCSGISFASGTIAPLLQRCKKAALTPGGYCQGHAATANQQRYMAILLQGAPEWEIKMREAARADGVSIAPGPAPTVAVAPPRKAPVTPSGNNATPMGKSEPLEGEPATTTGGRATRFSLPGIPDYFGRP